MKRYTRPRFLTYTPKYGKINTVRRLYGSGDDIVSEESPGITEQGS